MFLDYRNQTPASARSKLKNVRIPPKYDTPEHRAKLETILDMVSSRDMYASSYVDLSVELPMI